MMNKETVEGKFDQVSGAIKQKVGEVFHDQSLANSGVAEQVKGAAKETWGKTKDVASEKRADASVRAAESKDEARLRTEEHADSARDRIVNAAKNLKNDISEKLENVRDRHDV
jgi:uncharacterized protein YjbJ (UPF0337 family)